MESATTPPAPPPQPERRLTVGEVISEAFRLYGAHFATLIGTALVVFVIAGVIQGLLQETDSWVLQVVGSLVQLVAGVLYTGFVVSLVNDVRDGKQDFTVGELLRSASHAILPLIGNGILFGDRGRDRLAPADRPRPLPADDLGRRRARDRARALAV